MTKFCNGDRAFYEQIMQQPPSRRCIDHLACQGCQHFRPDWKYRFCELVECAFISGYKTFKECDEQ